MSAIAGIFNLDGQAVAPGALELLTGAMQAHGPDRTEHFRVGAVALGHCFLCSPARTAGERQPLSSPDGALVVVFDGRLDNRAEISARLRMVDDPAAPATDVELVLAAYREWGPRCPAKLVGEYVFAVWDVRERRLFLAKDPVGARQVYYCVSANRFAFASFDEALLCLPGVSREPCDEMVAGFLVPEFDDYHGEQTWLEAVRALKPAHSLCVSPEGARTQQRYWTFEPKDERAFSSEDECAAAWREVFDVAVQNRVRGAAEPATLLSGGIDSASVLATLEASRPGAPYGVLHTFSALLDPVDGSAESRAIASMTADKRVRAHLLRLPSFRGPVGFDDLMAMVWARAHPVDNALLLPALLCLAAQRAGQRSMLHAASGDVVLTALTNYIAPLLRAGHFRTAWRECRAASAHHTYLMGESPVSLLLRNAWSAFVPNGVRRSVRAARFRRFQALDLGWVHPDFARRLRLVERIRERQMRALAAFDTPFRVEHARRIFGSPGVASGLAGFQRVGSRYGVELYDPWADLTLLEHVLQLPLRQLVQGGWNKWPARAFLMQGLSPNVRWRTDKEHFGWLLTERVMAESVPVLEDSLARPDRAGEFVDFPAVRAALRVPQTLALQAKYDMVTLVQWLRRIRQL